MQIIDAERYLENLKKDKSLKPKSRWDSSVISLLNYPQIVKMMSDDLDWTQSLGDANGKWSFDTYEGLNEILARRIGENERFAIDTMGEYINAQMIYA